MVLVARVFPRTFLNARGLLLRRAFSISWTSSIGVRMWDDRRGNPGSAIEPACTDTPQKEQDHDSGNREVVQRREGLRLHRPGRRRRRRVRALLGHRG